jgi:hypothetical protein
MHTKLSGGKQLECTSKFQNCVLINYMKTFVSYIKSSVGESNWNINKK